jgi:hypothetical protein
MSFVIKVSLFYNHSYWACTIQPFVVLWPSEFAIASPSRMSLYKTRAFPYLIFSGKS